MLKTLNSNKLGLAILAVLLVIAAGVSVLAFNAYQAKRRDQIESKLIDLITAVHSDQILLSMIYSAGSDCDKHKATLAQSQQKLEDFLKAHPDAQSELEPYLIRTGLINNQEYMVQHGLTPDRDAQERQQEIESARQALAATLGYTPGGSNRCQ